MSCLCQNSSFRDGSFTSTGAMVGSLDTLGVRSEQDVLVPHQDDVLVHRLSFRSMATSASQ